MTELSKGLAGVYIDETKISKIEVAAERIKLCDRKLIKTQGPEWTPGIRG